MGAIEQERVTRVKADGADSLSNLLPVRECLRAAGASLDDVDLIVSSFQSMGPGGVGLHRPLVEPGFDLFDPRARRHLVVSHHYAHALCALGTSPFLDAAVIVCDLAGSTTVDGLDFSCSFSEFEARVAAASSPVSTRTECLSIYEARRWNLGLRHREYCVAHSSPEVFVCGAASLYDNVARMIFSKENAHGELMALASMGSIHEAEVTVDDIVDLIGPDDVSFRNDWQPRIRQRQEQLDYAPVAAVVQRALQVALLAHVRKTRRLTSARHLVAAGGVFLNIVANSEIADSGLFVDFAVPSAPHDAGIAIGCAFHGWSRLAGRGRVEIGSRKRATDRLGPVYENAHVDASLRAHQHLVRVEGQSGPRHVAERLRAGEVVARFAGRSEFGPRALGGRSILASPLRRDSKDRLNRIKGRQPWRPVAPIVPRDRIGDFFHGPADSPYMNFVHLVGDCHRDALEALAHPDRSARAQTLRREDDPFLYETIRAFGELTGYPILVNTSFNGPGEPIVETPGDALSFFLASDEIDTLFLERLAVCRQPHPLWQRARLAGDALVTIIRPGEGSRILLLRKAASMEISVATLRILERLPADLDPASVDGAVRDEMVRALRLGLLVPLEG